MHLHQVGRSFLRLYKMSFSYSLKKAPVIPTLEENNEFEPRKKTECKRNRFKSAVKHLLHKRGRYLLQAIVRERGNNTHAIAPPGSFAFSVETEVTENQPTCGCVTFKRQLTERRGAICKQLEHKLVNMVDILVLKEQLASYVLI